MILSGRDKYFLNSPMASLISKFLSTYMAAKPYSLIRTF
jgi:hypothetical protein